MITVLHMLGITNWQDGAEILFFTLVIYYFSLWLRKDRQKNLIPYFYSYCLVAFFAHQLNLSSISYILTLYAPATMMLFILIHQVTLQKNFVALRNIKPTEIATNDWIEAFIRSCLVALNHNKEIHCIIEHTDSLATLLTTPLIVQANFKQELFELLTESESFNPKHMVWLNAQGKLIGVNAEWLSSLNEQWISEAAHEGDTWKQDILFFTEKLDAIALRTNPTTRSFDLIIKGKSFDRLNVNTTLHYIKKYLAVPSPIKGINNETATKKDLIQ
jgi:hypothetical protein